MADLTSLLQERSLKARLSNPLKRLVTPNNNNNINNKNPTNVEALATYIITDARDLLFFHLGRTQNNRRRRKSLPSKAEGPCWS